MIQKLKPIRLNKYSGRNAFSEITNLGPTEFRSINDWDMYSGMAGDYLRTRRGSVRLGADALPDTLIVNTVVFPIAGEELFIFNAISVPGNSGVFYWQTPTGTAELIQGAALVAAGTSASLITNIQLNGLTTSNTDDYVLYYAITSPGTDIVISLYKDAARTLLVASGTLAAADIPEIMTLTEQNSSGITGSLYLTSVPSDGNGTIENEAFDVGAVTGAVDMKVYNDRVYVFCENGNAVIYYDSDQSRPLGRPLGLEAPVITGSQTQTGDMIENSTYTYGLEAVRIENGADVVASSPNRKWIDNSMPSLDGSTGGIGIYVDDDIFDDPYWTHIRLWRSKNQTPDFSDPLYPIDAQGTPDQLWEVALITRNELLATSVSPIDTGGDLPPGNANVEAGYNGLFYEITDGNDDSVLLRVIGLDLIELIPIPGCRTGAVNKGRIWSSGIGDSFIAPNGPNIDPVIREDWLYTNEANSQYQEQWDAQAYLDAGRDGKKTATLQVFMEDIVGIRENTTKRVAGGNPDSLVQMLDDKIGIPSFRMCGFISGIGVCAICSDGYFRYLGFDERWHQYIGKTEVSQSIYDLTIQASSVGVNLVDFVYMNGKLIMLIPDVGCAALGVKEGKGWSVYSYGGATAFNFASGERAAIATGAEFIREIEIAVDYDEDVTDDEGDDIPVIGTFETFGFSGEGGLLEVLKYSFWGKLSTVPTITAKSSNLTWEMRSGFIDPGLFAATNELNEREYLFEPQPLDLTPFKWVPLRGQFISFEVSAQAPAMISWQQVEGQIRPTNGNLGVYPNGGLIPQGPGWINSDVLLLNWEDPATTFYDASGKGIDLTWGGVGTKTNRVNQKPGKGLRMAGGGYAERSVDPQSPYIGVKNLSFKSVFSLDASGSYVSTGRNGDFNFRLQVDTTGAVFYATNGTDAYTYSSPFAFLPEAVYALTFVLSKSFGGQFFYGALSDQNFPSRTTTRTVGTPDFPYIFGVYSSLFENLSLGGSYAGQTLYGTLEQTTQFWRLYSTQADRNAQTNPVGFFSGPPSGNTFTFTAQNGSGITGTVDMPDTDPEFPFYPSLLDIEGAVPATGIFIQIYGVISYYETILSDLEYEQAKRFWGIMKAY